MRFFRRLRFLFKFRKSVPFFKEYFLSKQVKFSTKLIAIILIVGYIVFPFDLIPDYLLVIGIFDDVMIASLVLQQMIKMAPESLRAKYNLESK
ncbi:YkvA family protein [Gracilibacillus sp. HCP3S3_G5_1]|uniref:YkvA family protein n=1 Tax=unclassified Gracilibacillus TaxID=2625209 RepID=UPI003F8CDC06